MFRRIHYKLISAILLLAWSVSCSNPEASNKSAKILTPSKILSHFIKMKHQKKVVNGNYFFVCEGYCKGCVKQTLFSLDSLYVSKNWETEWTIVTSSEFVKDLPIRNIEVKYDPEWSKVNYVFNDVTYVKFEKDRITVSQTIDNKNLDLVEN